MKTSNKLNIKCWMKLTLSEYQTNLHDNLREEAGSSVSNRIWYGVEEGAGLTLQPSQVITP